MNTNAYSGPVLRRKTPVPAWFHQERDRGVNFVASSTECERTEADAREGGRRLHEMQMELAHANRVAMMGQLTASLVHDVSQPIAATVINAQAALRLLDRQLLDLEEVRSTLVSIVQDGDRARKLIGCMRALIKKTPSQRDLLDINEAIREVSELTLREAVKNDVTMQTELADGLPLIHGDRVGLQQVILNLIINAFEAMSGTSKTPRDLLISSMKADSGHVIIAVRDSGPGLGLATLERAFDAFYTTKSSGLGLGLSICRSIVEAHCGRIWAKPNRPRGAVFQFRLPAIAQTRAGSH